MQHFKSSTFKKNYKYEIFVVLESQNWKTLIQELILIWSWLQDTRC